MEYTRDYFKKLQEVPEYMDVSFEDLKCEVQLQALQDWEPLTIRIDEKLFMKEIALWEDEWFPYLPRDDRDNSRMGLLLTGLEGDTPSTGASFPQAKERSGKTDLYETDMCHPTEAYDGLTSLHELLDYFSPLGRTWLLKMGSGSYFPPHRDHPEISRKTFRVAAFIGPVEYEDFIWHMNGERMETHSGQVAYINTQRPHGTSTWSAKTNYHLIMNIPKTWENVIKLLAIIKN